MISRIVNRRLRRRDWTRLGLTLLAAGGPAALKLDRLCRQAGKTRGSFYHHFADHQTFTKEILDAWVEQNTLNVIERVDAASTRKKRSLLFRLTSEFDHEAEAAIRKLAASSADAEEAVARVDNIRIEYLAKLFKNELGFTAKRAALMAELQYASFLGLQILKPGQKKLDAIGALIDEMLMLQSSRTG